MDAWNIVTCANTLLNPVYPYFISAYFSYFLLNLNIWQKFESFLYLFANIVSMIKGDGIMAYVIN